MSLLTGVVTLLAAYGLFDLLHRGTRVIACWFGAWRQVRAQASAPTSSIPADVNGEDPPAAVAARQQEPVANAAGVNAFPGSAGVAGRWHALPGERLELADTGYAIELQARAGSSAYYAVSPEGNHIARSEDLSALKVLCERLAAEREEFLRPVEQLSLQRFMLPRARDNDSRNR